MTLPDTALIHTPIKELTVNDLRYIQSLLDAPIGSLPTDTPVSLIKPANCGPQRADHPDAPIPNPQLMGTTSVMIHYELRRDEVHSSSPIIKRARLAR